MALRESLEKVLASPSPEDLWALRAELLQAGWAADSETWPVIDEFQRFLDHLATSSTSREYSELASKLDIGAVSGVVLEHALETEGAGDLAQRVLAGLVSEGLMVLATRQHVKAWESEMGAVFRNAAWYLYGEIWRWSERQKPDQSPAERRRLLDHLFEPVLSKETAESQKAVTLGLLFQLLLVSRLAREIPR